MEKEKKEIGIEKLIELFKEYVDNHGTDTKDIEKEYGVIDYGQGFLYGTREYLYEIIISKDFGFIKWLVENEKVNPYDPSYNVPTHIALGVDDGDGDFMVYERFFKEEELLMLLSIQDEPINFLVSILK